MQRFTPISPTKSVMRYEVYRHKDATDADFNLISDMYKRIMSEDKYLCINTQKNLNAGVFVNGELHPEMEKGPIHFQTTLRKAVTEHYKKEQAVGHEIWPSEHRVSLNTAVTSGDFGVSTSTDCCGVEKDDLKDSLTGSLAPAITV